jgi:putative DNA-invertase from lambdoid prophage Rac
LGEAAAPKPTFIPAAVAAVAEFERDLLIERTQAGLARAKAGGKKLGRPNSLIQKQRETIRAQRR